ncbi:MAG: arsenate reductase ArsC [Myxococcales bacterium]|nr:arsenate reductase ArsC [Myxococcales bacterium]MDH5306665.1 arsenate reductase ArsC [Myxococcales bacterium]MDH5565260.1 arsenate reductase ArsC [Myxococcales bacterium]
MSDKTYHALFLCTGNSARSILAEAILNRVGGSRFRGHSAGSHPTGRVHPLALELLAERGYDVSKLRSKPWDEFVAPGAPPLDFIFTVCDAAAGEVCPAWPGHPLTAHWGLADPAALDASPLQQRQAFRHAYLELERRVALLTVLPLASIDRMRLRARLDEIGRRSASAPVSA